MKTFFGTLREHATQVINFIKKRKKLLTNEQQKSYKNAKYRYIFKEKLENKQGIVNLGAIFI